MFNMTRNYLQRKTGLQLTALFEAASRASAQQPAAKAAKAKLLMAMIQAEFAVSCVGCERIRDRGNARHRSNANCPSSKHLAQLWRGVNGERASSWGWLLGGELAVLQAAMFDGLFLDGGALGVDLPIAAK
jgi:hypothetical protein